MEKDHSYSTIINLPVDVDPSQILNINVGVLGHVDSGKTSLSKKLSSVASTASFDKNPQSQERGITLDLGFSAFYVEISNQIKETYKDNERLNKAKYFQITLVDCPGHASLIKTVVAGAAIIDVVVLVIDCVKGIQVQTTECLVLGEILADDIIIAFNKVDQLCKDDVKDEDEFNNILNSKVQKLRTAFSKTKFGENISICPVSAIDENNKYNDMLNNLVLEIIKKINFSEKKNFKEEQISKNNFIYSIDHCFSIKNKGTIITGTVLKGKIEPGLDIFFPSLNLKKNIKEIQMFKKNVKVAHEGDRVGMLIKNLNSQDLERSIACYDPDQIKYCTSGIFLLKKIKYYKQEITSKSKYYIVNGNQGVMGKCHFFGGNLDMEVMNKLNTNSKPSTIKSYELNEIKSFAMNSKQFYGKEYQHEDALHDLSFAFIKFEDKLVYTNDSILIGINIDCDISNKVNRIAFVGKMIDQYDSINSSKILKIIKNKKKEGLIMRMHNDYTGIIKDMFKKDSNINDFIGKKVHIRLIDETLEKESEFKQEDIKSLYQKEGTILGEFGQSGKIKVDFNINLRDYKLVSIKGDKEVTWKDLKVMLEYSKLIKL